MHNRKQRTQKTERNMKKTLITAVTLAACAATQLIAQNVKEGVITFSLTDYAQNSVSDSSTTLNHGGWNSPPTNYKTTSTSVATKNILQAIGIVLHKNAGYYSSKAQLVLVQGELSGFFNLSAELADVGEWVPPTGAPKDIQSDYSTTFADTSLTGGGTVARLANGRHILPNPISGTWPVGHHQPWGQIFVKDPGKAPWSVANPLCENVTFFFSITVQECYDCFYLNSFISDSKFKFVAGSGSGLPCCSVLESLQGSGKDKYYMTLSFDNTFNNPYLNPAVGNPAWIGGFGSSDITLANYNPYFGVVGVDAAAGVADGTAADLLPYVEPIISSIGRPSPYEMRFTLNGIVTYAWTLKLINKSDLVYDFVGSASYAANGYGFIALRCGFLTGSAAIVETIKPGANCCAGGMFKDGLWYDWWYGTGWNQAQSPWYAFDPAVPLPLGFGSPINMCADLSFHFGYDEEYEPGEQWGTNPLPDVPLSTPLDVAHPLNYVPVGR
jgi:hypothetical protein